MIEREELLEPGPCLGKRGLSYRSGGIGFSLELIQFTYFPGKVDGANVLDIVRWGWVW
jgi:hypothetical protein